MNQIKKPRRKKNAGAVIEASGEEVGAAPDAASPQSATQAPDAAVAPGASGAASVPDKSPPEPREASKEVLEATFAMAQAASQPDGGEHALALGDALDRQVLIDTIAFQLPREWITEEVSRRIQSIDTPSLSLVLTWLALNWWAGYEIGRNDTIEAIKKAAAKGMGASPESKAALAAVERQITEEREQIAREERESNK